jgi:hypothetical protein
MLKLSKAFSGKLYIIKLGLKFLSPLDLALIKCEPIEHAEVINCLSKICSFSLDLRASGLKVTIPEGFSALVTSYRTLEVNIIGWPISFISLSLASQVI